MIRPVRGHQPEQLRERLDDALERLQAVEAVCIEEASLGEFFASIDDGVRAGAHLHAAAHLRDALAGHARRRESKSLAS